MKLNSSLTASVTLLTLFLSFHLHAVPESQLEKKFESVLFPFYESGASTFYRGVDDKEVHFQKISINPACAILILPGRTEPTKKYAEVAYDLKDMGCDLILWDPRGQGLSERLIPDDIYKGYVENYRDYMTDFKTFWDREMTSYQKVGVVAHSMGAAIVLASLVKYQLPIHGLALSSPMMEIITQDLPEAATLWAMKVFSLIGKKRDYVPGGGPHEGPIPFEENRVTSSEARHKMAIAAYNNDGGPDLNMGSSTNKWLLEGIQITHYLKKRRNRKKLHRYPILLFQAGNDLFSKDERQVRFCSEHAGCELIRFENSKHEMFQERDEIRDQVMTRTKNFLTPRLKVN